MVVLNVHILYFVSSSEWVFGEKNYTILNFSIHFITFLNISPSGEMWFSFHELENFS